MDEPEHREGEATAERPGAAESTAREEPRGPALVPVHSIVFTLTAAFAVALGVHAAAEYHVAREASAYPSEVRRLLAFALFFNAAAGVAFVLVVLGEGLGALVATLRRRFPRRHVVRVLVALVPLAVFFGGHAVLNPWLWDLLERVRGLSG